MATRSVMRGVVLTEFALVCVVALAVLLAVVEYARLVFVWTAVQEATRRAARAVAVADFSDDDAMKSARRHALFREDDGRLALAPEVSTDNVVIDYLWQDTNGTLHPVSLLPACPAANRLNCARALHDSACIQFVRVRLCGPGDGCAPLPYHALTPLLPVPAAIPSAATVLRAESLGYQPGQAPCT